MEPIEIVVLAEHEEDRATVARIIEADERLSLAACLVEPGGLAATLTSRPPDALLVAMDEKADLFLDAIDALEPPRPPLVCLGPETDGRVVLRALRLGAFEYLPLDADADAVRHALVDLFVEESAKPEIRRPGATVAVLGAKGGVGASFLAAQLSLALQRLREPTSLVDLNLRHGDAALYLDLQPPYTLADVSQRDAGLDTTYLRSVLHAHPSGVQLLAAPAQPEEAELVSLERTAEAIEIARSLAEWVLLDVAREFDEVSLRALDLADEILLVTTLDIPALSRTHRMLALLERLGHPVGRIRLVVNRCGKANHVGEREVLEFLGRASDARLPNDFGSTQECVNYGRSLAEVAPQSELRLAVERLAAQLHEWRGLERPGIEAAGGTLERVRRFLRAKLHGAD